MKKVAVLVSGGGTNLQAILDAEVIGTIKSAKVDIVISDNEGAFALERAKASEVDAICISKKLPDFEDKLISALDERAVDLIVLAGFLSILSPKFTKHFEGRIINIHPSLIPSFCGKGYYGLKVHEAALARGVKLTGATVHYVNEIPDGGKIIAQRAVAVLPDDTPESLQLRVMKEAEHIILPRAIESICSGE